jgi:hypothetical protein
MAFKPKNFGSANPTGDHTFNKITKMAGMAKKDDRGTVKPAKSRKGGYDTATNTFRKMKAC